MFHTFLCCTLTVWGCAASEDAKRGLLKIHWRKKSASPVMASYPSGGAGLCILDTELKNKTNKKTNKKQLICKG